MPNGQKPKRKSPENPSRGHMNVNALILREGSVKKRIKLKSPMINEKDWERSIKKYMSEYRKLNPLQSKRDFRDVEEDLRLLIKGKEKFYPEVRIQIVNAHIQEVDGKIHVTVASLNRN
jgi:hypothetical protein